eukprot:m.22502 g.22502  ORF g.22502 m.22502 type:complete len:216 (-) comp7406_c0_seq1:984-1631(-)
MNLKDLKLNPALNDNMVPVVIDPPQVVPSEDSSPHNYEAGISPKVMMEECSQKVSDDLLITLEVPELCDDVLSLMSWSQDSAEEDLESAMVANTIFFPESTKEAHSLMFKSYNKGCIGQRKLKTHKSIHHVRPTTSTQYQARKYMSNAGKQRKENKKLEECRSSMSRILKPQSVLKLENKIEVLERNCASKAEQIKALMERRQILSALLKAHQQQ